MKLKADQEAQTVAIKRMSPQALQGLQNFQREVRLEETATESMQCTGV